MARRRGFGSIRRLPSKRYQASYIGRDLTRHPAPDTFETREDAEEWLARERRLVESESWTPPTDRRAARKARDVLDNMTINQFVTELWMPNLELRPTTQRDYESSLRNHILPDLGDIPVKTLTRAKVRAWWNTLDASKPRARSKALQLLHNILAGAVDLEVVNANPVTLPRGATIRPRRSKVIVPLSVKQVEDLADTMPANLRLAVLLGAWCGLRFGELSELRRRDIGAGAATITVERGVVKVPGGYVVGEPKTDAGRRTIHVPADLRVELDAHVQEHAGWGKDGLLFPAPNGGHLHATTFARAFQRAAERIGRPDATPHWLRHTHASLAAEINAPAPATMARLGHTTTAMTQRYTHAMSDADERLAKQLSDLRRKQA